MINLTWKKERIFSAKSRTFKTKSWPFPKEKLYIFQYKIFPHLADFPYLHYCSIGQIKKRLPKAETGFSRQSLTFRNKSRTFKSRSGTLDFQREQWDFQNEKSYLRKKKISYKKSEFQNQKVGFSNRRG